MRDTAQAATSRAVQRELLTLFMGLLKENLGDGYLQKMIINNAEVINVLGAEGV